MIQGPFRTKTQKTLIKGYDISYLDVLKGGSWVLSDILRIENLDFSDFGSYNILTSAKEKNSYACMGKQVDWSGRGWTVKCEAEYEYDATTDASTTTNAATTTTELTASTTTLSDDIINEEFNKCCKTWRIRNGEFKAFCDHKKIYPLHDWWVYECILENGHDTGKG